MRRTNCKGVAVTILLCGMFSAEAAAQEKKVTVPASELSAVIKKAIEKALPGGKVLKIEKEVEGEDPGQYDVEIRFGAKLFEVEISPQGEVIEVKETTSPEEDFEGEQTKKWTESFG